MERDIVSIRTVLPGYAQSATFAPWAKESDYPYGDGAWIWNWNEPQTEFSEHPDIQCLQEALDFEADAAFGGSVTELQFARPLNLSNLIADLEQLEAIPNHSVSPKGLDIEDWLLGGIHADDGTRHYVLAEDRRDCCLDSGESYFPVMFIYVRFYGDVMEETEVWTMESVDGATSAPSWWHKYLTCEGQDEPA